ncbi:MAG: LamG domain-containing protein, partial [Opitutae bacterium]|nr:LamG domain-containing protein [Opitutae bacterium]
EDTDSDGFPDSVEYQEGSDPSSNTSIPGLEYGLTAWYPFDGNASDMSGNGRHGTTHNGAGWAAGKVGQALSLDGVDDYIDAGDFEIGGAVTFAAWVKYGAFKHWSRVFDFGNGQDNNNILMANDGTSAASRFNIHLPSGNPSLHGTNLTLNNWLHRAGVIEANGNMRLYLNGSLVSANTNTSVLPTLTRTQQYVGRSNWASDGYLDGLIDDFRIYNRALSATEISNLHQLPNSDADGDGFTYTDELISGTNPNSASSYPNFESGLIAWYPFDGNSSDMSGNNWHATAVNSHSYVSAKVGTGVRIVGSSSGVTGHVSLPYISSLENSDYTFAFWVLEEQMLHYHGEDYLFYGQVERVSRRLSEVAFPFSSTNSYMSGIESSTWNHYVVTKSGSTNTGYLNGTLVATGSWSIPVSDTADIAALGRHWWSGGSGSSTRLVAVFDDLRIYDRSLSGTEVGLLYQYPNSDADGDGYSYADELKAGTNPNSSLSKPSLVDGLLLWYPLDGNTSDMSGNDRHASLSNANDSNSGFVDGKILKALDLDGVDDYLSVPHDSGLDLRRTLSLSIWLKLDAIPSTGYSAIMYKGGGNGGSSRTYSLWLENASRFIHATSADATDQESANSANSAFSSNSWMHLVMLLDRYNGSIKVFKDKALVANSTVRSTNTVSSQNPLLFGKSQESNSDFSVINGQMDDIRLYDRVLYSFEIEDLYDVVATDTDSDGLNDAEEILLDTN